MKTKYNKVNKCAACGEKASNIIWTSSRQVNKGIKVMYPKEKLCLKCYESMKSVYPEQPRIGYDKKCHCGGKIKETIIGLGDGACMERYCEDCGEIRSETSFNVYMVERLFCQEKLYADTKRRRLFYNDKNR